jgi:hypothetical protein
LGNPFKLSNAKREKTHLTIPHTDGNDEADQYDAYSYQDGDGAEAGSWLSIYHEAMFCAR